MGRPTVEVLEIGGGTGEFAAGFIRRARERLGPTREMRYTLLDCSETLLERQRRRLDGADCVLTMVKGDAEELSLSGRRFDIVLANEVIADFRVAPGRPGVNSLTHIGVSAFLRRLAGHLASGGMAFLTEYGELDRPPTRVEHLGHPEYSIRFGEVLETARSLGFHAVATWLPGFLHFRDEASMLVGQQEHILCLNHLIGRDAEPLPYAAWGRGAILGRLAAEIEDRSLSGLAFAPLAYGLQYGPDPRQFHVVSLAFGGAPERAS